MGKLEIFLIVIVLAALGWFGATMLQNKPGQMCAPVPLSQEVKAYIDSKMGSSRASQASEIPALIAKITELQTKMGAIEIYRAAAVSRREKGDELIGVADRTREKIMSSLQRARVAEIEKVKASIGALCSGGAKIPKSVKSSPSSQPPQSTEGDEKQ